jgi:hypothetical protein
MRKIYYVHSSQLAKSARDDYNPYTMVDITEQFRFGKVKVDTYCFDICCDYAGSNYIGTDIIDENIIKELNWDNILNDLKDGSIDRKYWYKYFLMRTYGFATGYDKIGSTKLEVYKDHYVIGLIDASNMDLTEQVLQELELILKYMIDHNIDKDNAERLLDIVKNDPEVRMTNEEYFNLKHCNE